MNLGTLSKKKQMYKEIYDATVIFKALYIQHFLPFLVEDHLDIPLKTNIGML